MTMPTEIMKVKICMAGEGAVGKTGRGPSARPP